MINILQWVRILRMIFGGGGLVQGIFANNFIMIVIGGLLLIQGVFNVGCLGATCARPLAAGNNSKSFDEIDFEEIKS